MSPKLATELMLTMGRRAQPDGRFWTGRTADLAIAAWNEAEYCLDAPGEIPAGSAVQESIAEDMLLAVPSVFNRESGNAE